jgi:hypothetical protein
LSEHGLSRDDRLYRGFELWLFYRVRRTPDPQNRCLHMLHQVLHHRHAQKPHRQHILLESAVQALSLEKGICFGVEEFELGGKCTIKMHNNSKKHSNMHLLIDKHLFITFFILRKFIVHLLK